MASGQHDKFLELYRKQQWELALKFAGDLRDEFNGMLTDYYDIMIERIIELQENDMPKDWDGVYRATSKWVKTLYTGSQDMKHQTNILKMHLCGTMLMF